VFITSDFPSENPRTQNRTILIRDRWRSLLTQNLKTEQLKIKKMKIEIKKIATLIIILVLTYSCENDENEPEELITETPSELINKWNLNKWSSNGINQNLTDCDKQKNIKFTDNGTFERKDYIFIGGNCSIEEDISGTYTYDNSQGKIVLFFTDPDDGNQTEILNNVELNSTILKYSWDEDGDGNDEHNLEYIL